MRRRAPLRLGALPFEGTRPGRWGILLFVQKRNFTSAFLLQTPLSVMAADPGDMGALSPLSVFLSFLCQIWTNLFFTHITFLQQKVGLDPKHLSLSPSFSPPILSL